MLLFLHAPVISELFDRSFLIPCALNCECELAS